MQRASRFDELPRAPIVPSSCPQFARDSVPTSVMIYAYYTISSRCLAKQLSLIHVSLFWTEDLVFILL